MTRPSPDQRNISKRSVDHADGLRRDDEFLVQDDAHLAAEQFEKNSNALAITHAFEQAEAIAEHAFAHANFVAGRKLRPAPKLNKALVVFAAFQTIDDCAVDRGGTSPLQTRRATPTVEWIDRHRWIAGLNVTNR